MLKQIVNEEGENDDNTGVPMTKELKSTASPRKDKTADEEDASEKLKEKDGSDNWCD